MIQLVVTSKAWFKTRTTRMVWHVQSGVQVCTQQLCFTIHCLCLIVGSSSFLLVRFWQWFSLGRSRFSGSDLWTQHLSKNIFFSTSKVRASASLMLGFVARDAPHPTCLFGKNIQARLRKLGNSWDLGNCPARVFTKPRRLDFQSLQHGIHIWNLWRGWKFAGRQTFNWLVWLCLASLTTNSRHVHRLVGL